MRRRLEVALCALVVAAACTGGSNPPSQGLPGGHGGTLRIVFTRSGGTPYLAGDYDPQVSGDSGAFQLMRCCLFRTLLSYNGEPTEKGGAIPRPDLATGLPDVSTNGLTWTFHLKTGIHYAPPFENREIVGQDFIRALDRTLQPVTGKLAAQICGGTPCQLGGYIAQFYTKLIRGARSFAEGRATTISGVSAPDPHMLRITLTHPSGELAYLVALEATAPIPPKPGDPGAPLGAAQGHDRDWGRGFAVSSGPYMVQGSDAVDFSLPPAQQKAASGAASGSFTVVRNPAWDPSTDDLRVGYPDRIVITGVKDLDTGERMVQRDQADMVGDFTAPPPIVERFRRSPALADQVYVDPFDVISVLTLNTAMRPLDDLNVRRALNYAIDKEALRPWLAKYASLSRPATHIGIDSQENDLLLNYAPYGKGSGDLRAARAEMAKSRYDKDADGRCDGAACRHVGLIFPGDDQARAHIAALVKADLAPLGIGVDLHPEGDDWRTLTSDPSSHVALDLVGYVKDFPSASDFFESIFPSRLLSGPNPQGDPTLLGATPEELRKWKYPARSVPNVDGRLDACDREIFAGAIQCWAGFDQYLTEQVAPWVPLLAWTGAEVVSSRVKSFSWDQSTPYPAVALDRIRLNTAQAKQ